MDNVTRSMQMMTDRIEDLLRENGRLRGRITLAIFAIEEWDRARNSTTGNPQVSFYLENKLAKLAETLRDTESEEIKLQMRRVVARSTPEE